MTFAFLASLTALLVVIPIAMEQPNAAWIVGLSILGANLLWYLPALWLAVPYYRSLRYEIREDEVVVRVGILTHSVKYVPYRTITNLSVKRGPLDRLLGTSSVNIQTAGYGGTSTPEQSLAGLEDGQSVYDVIAGELRRFRSAMGPTAAAAEEPPGTLAEILQEVRAIRKALQQR